MKTKKINQLKPSDERDQKIDCVVIEKFNESDISSLTTMIENSPLLKKISIHVDSTLLVNKSGFISLLKGLNKPLCVELIFTESDIKTNKKQLEDNLNAIAEKISYPLQIKQLNSSDNVIARPDLHLKHFEECIIKNIQARVNTDAPSAPFFSQASSEKKVKFKDLIHTPKSSDISFEVVHIENVEEDEEEHLNEEIAHDLTHESQVYLNSNPSQNKTAQYEPDRKLLGFQEFYRDYRKTIFTAGNSEDSTDKLLNLLQQELFANFPEAIKYISPEAAKQLALNLPNLVTLNSRS